MWRKLIAWFRSLFRRPSPAPKKEAATMELTFSDGRRIGTLRNVTFTPTDYRPESAPRRAPMPKNLSPLEVRITATFDQEQSQKLIDLLGIPKPPPKLTRQQRREQARREWQTIYNANAWLRWHRREHARAMAANRLPQERRRRHL